MKKLFMLLAIAVSVAVALPLGCARTPTAKERPAREIAVLKLGDHAVIDLVVESMSERIRALSDGDVRITISNAAFDMQALSALARSQVKSSADILVPVTTPAASTVMTANRGKKPLVFTFVTDPRGAGYEGVGKVPNVTGLSDQVDVSRSLGLIRSMMPSAKKLGYLVSKGESNAVVTYQQFQREAETHGFTISVIEIANASDIRNAVDILCKSVDTILVGPDNNLVDNIDVILDCASRSKRPVFACDESSVKAGAVAAMSVDYRRLGRETADVIFQILGGADPSQIDCKIVKGDMLCVNSSALEATGLTVPDSLASQIAKRF